MDRSRDTTHYELADRAPPRSESQLKTALGTVLLTCDTKGGHYLLVEFLGVPWVSGNGRRLFVEGAGVLETGEVFH